MLLSLLRVLLGCLNPRYLRTQSADSGLSWLKTARSATKSLRLTGRVYTAVISVGKLGQKPSTTPIRTTSIIAEGAVWPFLLTTREDTVKSVAQSNQKRSVQTAERGPSHRDLDSSVWNAGRRTETPTLFTGKTQETRG